MKNKEYVNNLKYKGLILMDTVILRSCRDTDGMAKKYKVEILEKDYIRTTVYTDEFQRMVNESPNPRHIRSLLLRDEDKDRF